ncbi:MAG: capsular polysaccharide biosynthesis protein, partial [Oceanobacter sp.]
MTTRSIAGTKPAFCSTSAHTCSKALSKLPLVNLLWPGVRVHSQGFYASFRSRSTLSGHTTALGWGRKSSGEWADRQYRAGKVDQLCLLEDGFLRSVDREGQPLAMVLDDRGIYYDASTESRLEQLIQAPLDEVSQIRARQLIELWQQSGVSKYNGSDDYSGQLPDSYVLVVDQVANDSSISFGGATAESFSRMLQVALADNPNATILLKVHPDAVTRKKAGHFDLSDLSNNPRIHVITDACHPVMLIQQALAVYTVTSQMGFEALMHGKAVHCFGSPFYAGWGLTKDYGLTKQAAERRYQGVSLEQLVHAALIEYCCYLDPETGAVSTPEDVIQHLTLQRKKRFRFSDAVVAVGVSPWKRPIFGRFLAGTSIHFARSFRSVSKDATVLVWGSRSLPDRKFSTVIRVEDGFIRSRGLGAELTEPMSWVLDDLGMYYDASRPSRLESILSEQVFSDELIRRAGALIDNICRKKISKYNLSAEPWQRPENSRRVILVPGQVADDASIRFGAIGKTRTNEALLARVRQENPEAWVVYKPHPDVVASLRAGALDLTELETHCDELLIQGDSAQLLDEVDEVHTLTSLMGFEALLRGCKVVCYGAPFYSGWGLTEDKVVVGRRQRDLSLNELVAGALILYPDYIHPNSGEFTQVETIVEYLANSGT